MGLLRESSSPWFPPKKALATGSLKDYTYNHLVDVEAPLDTAGKG